MNVGSTSRRRFVSTAGAAGRQKDGEMNWTPHVSVAGTSITDGTTAAITVGTMTVIGTAGTIVTGTMIEIAIMTTMSIGEEREA